MIRIILFLLLSILSMTSLTAADTPSSEKRREAVENIPLPPELIEQEQPSDDRFYHEFVKMLLTLGFIILLIFVLIWMMKKMSNVKIEQSNLGSSIKILEKRNLSPKTTLYLLDIGDKGVAISESINGVTLISDFPLPEEKS